MEAALSWALEAPPADHAGAVFLWSGATGAFGLLRPKRGLPTCCCPATRLEAGKLGFLEALGATGMTATNGTILSLSDIDTTIDAEPRVRDVLLAEKLGFERPRVIRELINRHQDELEAYGDLAPRNTAQLRDNGASHVVEEYYLNEQQALLLCMFSRTAKAAEVRKALIEVFIAWRSGQAADPSQTRIDARYALDLAHAITYCDGDDVILGPTDRELCARALHEYATSEIRSELQRRGNRSPQRFAERLARKVSEAGENGVQRTALMTMMSCNAASLDGVLAPLIEAGAIIERRGVAGAEPGRPSTRYYSR
ncbi:hypothetical protein [Bradyrhizobium sp. SZCCHNR2009]|uniref:hypothetical protein n=1 Tax=Bradyrhizobium sp. SZCCHNR2009 TaxID=3057375 RepID=UPI0028EF4F03|nr:hypothetical protein [Bradyrhizobium sp. SZCCHNR2009]